MTNGTGRRRYESLRRLTQAHQTRAAIADAARELFLNQGWAGTTIRAVAREAQVSVPTVYAAYGNKAGLAQALVGAAGLSADLPQLLEDLEATEDPHLHLAAMAGFDRRLYERAGDLITLVREAGRTESELADFYRQAREEADETRIQVFTTWPPGTFRDGLDVDAAVDIYAGLCNIDVYTTFTRERGWPPERVEEWWCGVLTRELLQAPG